MKTSHKPGRAPYSKAKRSPIRTLYRQRLNRIMSARKIPDLSLSALVFAPHPDDETLGCGGTIIRKKAASAALKIVFMTDGSRSHAALMDEETLRMRRQQEAIAAAETLGVAANDVTFLGFGDGRLGQSQVAAIDRVCTLLKAHLPAEVFVPHPLEPPPDHVVTYQIVMTAIQQLSLSTTVYAYPIWYWRHWPWTGLIGDSRRDTLEIVKTTVRSGLGTAIFRDFQHAVYIGSVLGQKQLALEQHTSQMARPTANPDWPILEDVSHGDFLSCFLQDYELFHSPSL